MYKEAGLSAAHFAGGQTWALTGCLMFPYKYYMSPLVITQLNKVLQDLCLSRNTQFQNHVTDNITHTSLHSKSTSSHLDSPTPNSFKLF